MVRVMGFNPVCINAKTDKQDMGGIHLNQIHLLDGEGRQRVFLDMRLDKLVADEFTLVINRHPIGLGEIPPLLRPVDGDAEYINDLLAKAGVEPPGYVPPEFGNAIYGLEDKKYKVGDREFAFTVYKMRPEKGAKRVGLWFGTSKDLLNEWEAFYLVASNDSVHALVENKIHCAQGKNLGDADGLRDFVNSMYRWNYESAIHSREVLMIRAPQLNILLDPVSNVRNGTLGLMWNARSDDGFVPYLTPEGRIESSTGYRASIAATEFNEFELFMQERLSEQRRAENAEVARAIAAEEARA